MLKEFPKDFLWGSASASYQIEGAYKEDNKLDSIWDNFVRIPNKTFKGTNGDVAVDFYHNYKDDIKLMAEQGLKTYRFSISWARIYPKGKGDINELGLKFYEDVIDTCISYGIEPMVTIYHWDLPQALQDDYQGWESRNIIDDYTNYAITLFNRFGSKVKYWITMNEQNIFTNQGWITATHPPGKKEEMKIFYLVNHNVNMAHAKTVLAFKRLVPNGKIGASFAFSPSYAINCDPKNAYSKLIYDDLLVNWWMDVYAYGRYPKVAYNLLSKLGYAPIVSEEDAKIMKDAAQVDFMGLNYYQSIAVMYNPIDGINASREFNTNGVKGEIQVSGIPGLYANPSNPYLKTTDWDWTIDPCGLKYCCNVITSRYNLPIVISENGLGAFDKLEVDGTVHDKYRIDYIKEHLLAVNEAIEDGCEILAYCTWSFTDLLSWLNGYQKRYGFVYVDQQEEGECSLKRYPKDSYYWYKEIIASNGKDLYK